MILQIQHSFNTRWEFCGLKAKNTSFSCLCWTTNASWRYTEAWSPLFKFECEDWGPDEHYHHDRVCLFFLAVHKPRRFLCSARGRAFVCSARGRRIWAAAHQCNFFSSFVLLLFLKGFWLCFFTDFLDFYFPAGFFGFSGRFTNI
jgi:hypothetical protein